MFRRRDKRPFAHLIRNVVWPLIGWRRSAEYWAHRIGRQKGSVYSIAAGFACGAAISFTPLIGLHLLGAVLLALLIRGSAWAAAIGTAVGNPWTFPVIWVWTYKLGTWLGVDGVQQGVHLLDFTRIFGGLVSSVLRLDFSFFANTAWPVLAPMLVGGLVSAFLVWVATYFSISAAVETYRVARRKRLNIAPKGLSTMRRESSR